MIVLAVCTEGENSEPNYIEALKNVLFGTVPGENTAVEVVLVTLGGNQGFKKIFEKADKPGWASIIPFYSSYVLFEITWGKGILFLLMCIPLVNIVISIMTMIKLSNAFGQGAGMSVMLILLPVVAFPILAFGDSEYYGVPVN